MLFYRAKPLPRILVQKAHTNVKGRSAPAFDGVVARLVHRIEYALELIEGKARGDERLIGVPQHRFGETDFFHIPHLITVLTKAKSVMKFIRMWTIPGLLLSSSRMITI